jgi:hypothetical protein
MHRGFDQGPSRHSESKGEARPSRKVANRTSIPRSVLEHIKIVVAKMSHRFIIVDILVQRRSHKGPRRAFGPPGDVSSRHIS